ncbi:MAG TPA: ATP-binding protein, partial [Nitrospirota bacterium]|nr:ATP-binding protein [Nitrospirota bacterium]
MMKRIAFKDSIASRLLLAIIAFPAMLTLGGFLIFQEVESQRIAEFSGIKMRQLEHFNSTLLLSRLDSFKEKAIRIASDNQIIVPYKLKVNFQIKAYLEKLADLDELGTISVMTPDGVSDITAGHPIKSYRSDFLDVLENARAGQPTSYYIQRQGQTKANLLCLAAATPILTGNEVIAVLLIAKDVILDKPYSNTLLVSEGRVQSASMESSFLLPFVAEAAKRQEIGPVFLPGSPIVVSKIALPELKEPDSYLICGIDENSAFDQNKKIVLYGIIISTSILGSLSAYSIFLSRRLTRPLLRMVNAADHIAKGNFEHRLAVSSKDETGHLSNSLNRMMESLAESGKALKQATDSLLLIMDAIAADIYVADMQTYEVLFMNKAMQKNFGGDLTGRICYDAFRNETKPCAHCTNNKLLDAVGKIGSVYAWECTNPITGISYINYDRAIQWVDGRIVRLQIATDVSARKKAEDELKHINEELDQIVQMRTVELENVNSELRQEISEKQEKEKALLHARAVSDAANRAKSEFLANMSHELRTPLNHIIGFTDLVLSRNFGELTAEQEEFLKDVVGSSRHLLSLINDVLDLSKVEAGKMELELSEVRIRELLEGSLVMVKEKALKQHIRLSTDLDGVPEAMLVDERKMKQVVYNLLSNSVKFTPAGGEVRIGAKIQESSELDGCPIAGDENGHSKWLSVWVSDTGIGLEQQNLSRIFNPFEQVEGSASRKFQGTGLGLALTRRMVELHGGAVWAESDGDGKGSTFRFAIPVRIAYGSRPSQRI